MEHQFTSNIHEVLEQLFGSKGKQIFESSQLLQYLNFKTQSANRGSKSRGRFANLYAIYVLVEDYLEKGYDKMENTQNMTGPSIQSY